MEQNDRDVLIGSPWSATPADYSSLRFLRFKADGLGEAVFGYGQTIYADVIFEFDLPDAQTLRLKYLSSPARLRFKGFEPDSENAVKLIQYKLARSSYRDVEFIVGLPFTCDWLLTLGDSPWPAGMTFPYPQPTEFYGYRRDLQRQPGA